MRWVLVALAFFANSFAIQMDPNNQSQVEQACSLVIQGMLDYFPYAKQIGLTGGSDVTGGVPGMPQEPYYWYEGGVATSALVEWATLTGNDTFTDYILDSITFQGGDDKNFMTNNQTSVEGNDDEAMWGLTAMQAAERNFTRANSSYPPWLYYAQSTFSSMASRWDTSGCNGGVRWQIYPWNSGYNYKNSVSNGALFNLAARLSRFTNNATYVHWADRIWDWMEDTGQTCSQGDGECRLLTYGNSTSEEPSEWKIRVLDGASMDQNCSEVTVYEWTYNQGMMISGAAYLYNQTKDQKWWDRVQGLWSRTVTPLPSGDGSVFFGNNAWSENSVLYEPACMTLGATGRLTCTNDQRCFRAVFTQLIGNTMHMLPGAKNLMWSKMSTTAQAASFSCDGGYDGHTCGLNWTHSGYDGNSGLGEQISALGAFNAILAPAKSRIYRASDLPDVYKPSNSSGGDGQVESSQGAVYGFGDAGSSNKTVTAHKLDIGGGDKAGAGVLTAVVVLFLIGSSAWLVF